MQRALLAGPLVSFFADVSLDDDGRRRPASNDAPPSNGNNRSSKPRGIEYVDLRSIRPGEMTRALELLQPQFAAYNPNETILTKNKFYVLPLFRHGTSTPLIVGKLYTFLPRENMKIRAVESLDLIVYFENARPARVQIEGSDIDLREKIESNCLRVQAWLTEEEEKTFKFKKNEIERLGFALNLNQDVGVLQNTLRIPTGRFPWMFLISSAWIEAHSDYEKGLILWALGPLVQKSNRVIVNYREPNVRLSLNNHFGMVAQSNRNSFFEAQDVDSVLLNLQIGFEKKLASKSLSQLTR